jgi:hypothetical protein
MFSQDPARAITGTYELAKGFSPGCRSLMSTEFWGARHRINRGDPVGPKTGPEGAKTRFCALVSCLKLLDALEDLDDVRSVTSNLEADEALLS